MQERTITIIARMSGELVNIRQKLYSMMDKRCTMKKNDPRRGKLNADIEKCRTEALKISNELHQLSCNK